MFRISGGAFPAPSQPEVKLIYVRLLVMAAALAVGCAQADELELGAGYGYTNTDGMNTQFMLYRRGHWWMAVERSGGRDFVPANHVAAGYQWSFREGRMIRPYLRIGVAYTDTLIPDPHDDPNVIRRPGEPDIIVDDGFEPLVTDRWTHYLGGGVVLWDALVLGVVHNSTGGHSDRNQGYDRFTLSFRLDI